MESSPEDTKFNKHDLKFIRKVIKNQFKANLKLHGSKILEEIDNLIGIYE